MNDKNNLSLSMRRSSKNVKQIQNCIKIDTEQIKKERLKSNQSRNIKLFEKNNIYYQIFDKDNCAVALIDGYINNGKIRTIFRKNI